MYQPTDTTPEWMVYDDVFERPGNIARAVDG